ncbi:MAG: undecaprenyl/decaprenyl-phosphate alpha-N-acetylglucosaminyl 1-phosphate transferase [Pirellulales bacterium]|nr:undecaprenyl/decaprenyl-phosphate alpha-N-acetylglucosaminyl 1-phosphate transferase [Pirellulales bacterium]
MGPLWITFLITLVASLALTPAARFAAARLGAVDAPDGLRKLHSRSVPLWGGVAVYVALLIGLTVGQWAGFGEGTGLAELATVLIFAAGFVCLIGCVDDSWDLNPRFKLLLQIVAVLPIAAAGYAIDRVVIFGTPLELGWLGVPLTVLWLVGCINALNLLDGMDGLAATVGLSTAAMMAVIATTMGHHHVAIIAVALAGALAGFLVYNLPPASIFLGDSGSMVIGLLVGILGIQGSLKTTATLSLTVPAVVLSIPMLDTALAIVRRRLLGMPIDAPDRGHIHHRLLERGLSVWQALCIIGALVLATGAAATAATIFRNDALAWITVVTLLVLLVRTRAFGHYEFSLLKLRVASAMAWAVNLLVQPGHGRSRLRRKKSAGMSFAGAWQALCEEAAICDVKQLDLTIWDAEECVGRHSWANLAKLPEGGFEWTLDFCFGDSGQVSCGLRATGRQSSAAHGWNMQRLTRTLTLFGEYWTARPMELPRVLSMTGEEAQLPVTPHSEAA